MRRGLVNCQFVAENIKKKAKNFKVVDATMRPKVKKTAKEEYLSKRIVGAVFFDLLGKFSDPRSPYSNTLPSLSHFKHQIAQLGIEPDDFVVAYESGEILSTPRCWWLFRVMGWKDEKIAVMEGGLREMEEKYPELVDHTPLTALPHIDPYPGDYPALALNEQLYRDLSAIEKNQGKEVVVDARNEGRFKGDGHIPGSINLPYDTMLDPQHHMRYFKSNEEIKAKWAEKGVDISDSSAKPIIASCGSGLTACTLLLSLHTAGVKRNTSLYDGSWTEYSDPSTGKRPIETGEAK